MYWKNLISFLAVLTKKTHFYYSIKTRKIQSKSIMKIGQFKILFNFTSLLPFQPGLFRYFKLSYFFSQKIEVLFLILFKTLNIPTAVAMCTVKKLRSFPTCLEQMLELDWKQLLKLISNCGISYICTLSKVFFSFK